MSTSVTRSTIRVWAVASSFALALGASTLGPASAAAQQTALLQGVVAEEETGRLIPSATVTLVGAGIETRSGVDGIFAFPEAPLGRVLLRVQAPGYPAVVEEVEVTPGVVLFMPVFLPSAVSVLEELLVIGTPTDAVDKTEAARTAADLLALQIPEIRALTRHRGRPFAPTGLVLRGRGTFLGGEPTIMLDGARISGGIGHAMDMLRQIPAAHVKRIQLLKGPSSAFLYGSADGVIVIETQSGPGKR